VTAARARSGGGDGTYSVRAVDRVLDILDLLQETDGNVSLSDIVERTQLPKTSAFRYLATLEERGYVERAPETGHYTLGLAFLPLQSRRLDQLAARARPHLERLRGTFGETVNLGLLDGTRVAYLVILESQKSIRFAARPGDRDPVHSTALGKAIAAHLEESRVRDILEAEGMPRQTDRTITDVDAYVREIARVRERGYAIDDRENEPHGRCVAVGFADSRLPAAISVSAPAARLTDEHIEPIAREITAVVEQLGREFTGRGGAEPAASKERPVAKE
jgi:IclR family transcriptional regulator, acetate operon repressor